MRSVKGLHNYGFYVKYFDIGRLQLRSKKLVFWRKLNAHVNSKVFKLITEIKGNRI